MRTPEKSAGSAPGSRADQKTRSDPAPNDRKSLSSSGSALLSFALFALVALVERLALPWYYQQGRASGV